MFITIKWENVSDNCVNDGKRHDNKQKSRYYKYCNNSDYIN